jgi:lipopolysaccharide transport protein LptA
MILSYRIPKVISYLTLFPFAFILFWSPLKTAYALTSTISDSKIYLEADKVNYDYNKGILHYEGHVHARQEFTNLTAEEVFVYYNKAHKIEKVVAIGNLAHYSTLLNEKKDSLKASAKKINYFPLAGKVTLENEATVDYNRNTFSGPFIFYDLNKKVISSHPQKNSRSRIVLEPINQLKLK